MSPYADRTDVTVSSSIGELDRMLTRRGAKAFGYMREQGRAAVVCQLDGRHIRFSIALPSPESYRLTEARKVRRSDADVWKLVEQEERRRWRSLTLLVKAMLVAAEDGVVQLSEALLPYTVLPGGATVYEHLGTQLDDIRDSHELPSLLPATGPKAIEP